MSELLKNLRMEQDHYNYPDGLDRYERIKIIADHIQSLEEKIKLLESELEKRDEILGIVLSKLKLFRIQSPDIHAFLVTAIESILNGDKDE